MITSVQQPNAEQILSQLSPLNKERRDHAIWLFAKNAGRLVTQYDVCKFHVMTDVFHVLDHGTPVLGGQLQAWPYGPVIPQTYKTCKKVIDKVLAFGMIAASQVQMPACVLAPEGFKGSACYFVAGNHFNGRRDLFTDSEVSAMKKAAELLNSLNGLNNKSEQYFHKPVSAVGYAWQKAVERCPDVKMALIDWRDVLDGAESIENLNVDYPRAIIEMWA